MSRGWCRSYSCRGLLGRGSRRWLLSALLALVGAALLLPTAVAQEDSEPATVVPPYSPATTQSASQPLSPEQRALMFELARARQHVAIRREYVELQEQIAQALARRWGSLPAHVGVEIDAVGRPYFIPYQDVPQLRRPHDGMFLEAVEAAADRPWVLLGDIEPVWSDSQRVWGVLEAYPHLLHSGHARTGDWEMLLADGSVLRGQAAMDEHLLSHRDPRFRNLSPRIRPPLPADANLGRWLPSAGGRDGTLHLFAHDPEKGLVVRSGTIDTRGGASQVANWPLIVLDPQFTPQQQVHAAEPTPEIQHARLPDGSIWVMVGSDAKRMWRFTPGEAGGWEAVAAPEPHPSLGTADTVLPLPASMGTGEMILFDRQAHRLVQRTLPLELDPERRRHLDVLVTDLRDPDYEIRERATKELSRESESIGGYLRDRLEESVSPEQRNRLLSVLLRLENRSRPVNRLLLGEERIDFQRAHLIADGRHGRGVVLLLEDPRRAPREAPEPDEAALRRGRPEAEKNPPLLLFIDYRSETQTPRVRLEPVIAGEASLVFQGPGHRSGAWIDEDLVWRGDGHAFEREDEGWRLRDRRPPETEYLRLRALDREGRVYFDTTWGQSSEAPLLVYNANAPVIVESPPDDALAFAEFPDLSGLAPVPPDVDADSGSVTSDGGWGRLGHTVGEERLVRLRHGKMEEMPLMPKDEQGRRPQLVGIVPLRGGAVVLSSTYAEAPATFWDGLEWHIAPTVEQLVRGHATALAARAGADPKLYGLGGNRGLGLASDGQGGLWFIQHQQINAERDEAIVRVEHFDGRQWRDVMQVLAAAGGGPHPVYGQVPAAIITAETGRLLIVHAYLTPDEAVDRRTASSVQEVLFSVRLEEDGTLCAHQLGAPRSGPDLEVVGDAQGRLWSRAFGPESHILGVWINGETLPRTRDEAPRIRERFTALPPVRPPYRLESDEPVEQERVSSLAGRLQLLDREERLWLIAGHVGEPGDAHPQVYVRVPASSPTSTTGPATTPTTTLTTQPNTLAADRDDDRPENVDVLGGEWVMRRLEQIEGDASGGFHLLPLADGSVWLVSREGIGRLEIVRSGGAKPLRELQLIDFRPWPQPLERVVAAFPDGNGLWIDPGHNRYHKRLPTRYVQIRPTAENPAALDR